MGEDPVDPVQEEAEEAEPERQPEKGAATRARSEQPDQPGNRGDPRERADGGAREGEGEGGPAEQRQGQLAGGGLADQSAFTTHGAR